MLRRPSSSMLPIVALVSIATLCHAQSPALMTRHMRAGTLNGQAPLVGRLAETQAMRLTLVLPLRDQEELDNFLQELYDPSSSSYHRFLTVEQFTERFCPTQEDYNAVIRFAESNGLTVVGTSRNRVNLDVTGSVANIERALHVTLGLYRHPTENRAFYAPDREPTPDISVNLWHISGLDNYSIPRPMFVHKTAGETSNATSNATTGSGPNASFLGSDMRAAYYGGTLTGSGQSVGLLEFVGTDLADLNTYYKNVGQTNNVPIKLLSTDGTSTSCTAASKCDDTEQTLDMTQALGMAPGLSSLVVYVGSSDASIFNAMATASPLNAQLSSSWTWSPADPNTDNPYFKEFAAQGQNLFQASGDSGHWTSSSEIYPADDAFITSVGGTDLQTAGAGGPWSSETTWVDGGGGISPDNFSIPSWQTAAASGCSNCSQTLRNGPDVSANANFTFYVCANQTTCTANEFGGTSFAAPMWAGYLALVNQQAVANGKSTLGFINPSLYSIGLSSNFGSDFHDIISGSNGFSATTGYDLATGWGSPNGSGLLNALVGPSSNPSFTISSSPNSVTVSRGSTGTSTITITSAGGFNSATTLSASGLPSGVTATFSTNPVTPPANGSATSTLTLTASSSATIGATTITINGTSGSSTHTTTIALTVNASSIAINAGGPAVAPFVADTDFSGGSTINHANTINLTGVTNPAPMQVYQTARIGNFSYTIPGFTAGSSHTVRLHFAETYWTAAGKRRFNVSVNGTRVLTNFDIFAAAGAKNKAIVMQFTVNANTAGQYVIQFTTVTDNSLVSGIEVQ
jgi:subtilase family serine protease